MSRGATSQPRRNDSLTRLLAIMRKLRSPQGCPWDREQTHASIKPNLIEESYETLDAIDSGDPQQLKEELGDVLLQVVFHAQMADEAGQFNFDDVARILCEKLERRHPHVFGTVKVSDSREVLKNWETIKRGEKKAQKEFSSVVAGLPRHLPALLKAEQVQRKASRVGFDWKTVTPVAAKVEEELAEVRHAVARRKPAEIREELGDLLFAVVNLGRFLGHSAEEALDGTVRKFVRRFQEIERRLHVQGREMTKCSLAELDAIWEQIKREEKKRKKLNRR
ncbi:MAG: nucleoside triphosphate pyrophosphohydrolase [Verrucomicrobia bacterium]|nr:MAG: nucleoside triphosphate pyrophosphohydrolase [Verrucomicrobiota bacterium]